ncbi:MAG: nicotinate dehydrogenase subunit [Candidatus Eremiobacteraeota bacterium]|jgi:aerobic-type carbon monoxide dehydrogenase small subunit (CoxS/CutS family)|nr:nicotinate dehydrogenase subunit [Candidatus Eremiobacteraeota bacterium]MEA2720760.1 nicotinate dehydrogenase subunit [Candidatus Eremiobacteraeota bacterium]
MPENPRAIRLNVDGTQHTLHDVDPSMPLLYVLRDEIGLANPRFGCGLAQCGACTVQLDGEPVRSCVLPVAAAAGKRVTTIAGLGTADHPHPVQRAFVEEQAMQCGYCINGWVMTGAAVVDREPHPSPARIREACAGLVCRCGAQLAMMRAIERAAAEKA